MIPVETSLLRFFEWCEATAIGHTIKDWRWLFPVTEAVHLLGLSVLGGSLLILDLRMLGVGLRRQSIGELAKETRPWLLGSIVVMLLTGTALFVSESVKCYYSQAFWLKITTLPVAIIFTLTYVVGSRWREPAYDTLEPGWSQSSHWPCGSRSRRPDGGSAFRNVSRRRAPSSIRSDRGRRAARRSLTTP